ncbi:hypothetical protein D1007_08450 [Hordeum vulgare]|nr:hypothetical protein D1007_08450 [Hordeum vulgare]
MRPPTYGARLIVGGRWLWVILFIPKRASGPPHPLPLPSTSGHACSPGGNHETLAMGFFGKGKGKLTPVASSSKVSVPPRRCAPPRECLYIPVHQARWHWQYRQALPYPDVELPHGWHLDTDRIPIPGVQRSVRAHAEEVRRRRALLTPEQRHDPTYATDSPEWEVRFAVEHERERIHDAHFNMATPPPPPQVKPEEQEDEVAYQATLEEATAYAINESRREEDARWVGLEKALALFAAGDCVMPPPPPPPAAEAEARQPHTYQWTGQLQEWVSAPPVWYGCTKEEEQEYLLHYKSLSLAREEAEAAEQMKL